MYMLSALSDGLRCACCVLCLFVVGGPIFITAGIVLLVIGNPREGKVSEYNAKAAAYTPVAWPAGTIGGEAITDTTKPVTPSGSKDGINIVNSRYASAVLTTRGTTVQYVVGSYDFVVRPRYSTTKTGSVSCRSSRSRRSRSSSTCSQSDAEDDCKDKYGQSARVSSCFSSCTCTYTAYLKTFCAVGVEGGTTTQQSCFYPFGLSDQGTAETASQAVEYQLRSHDDPFMAMQRITEGSMDFGLTRAMQRTIALVCLGIGIAIIVCDVVVGIILYKVISAAWRRKNQGQPSGASNGQVQPAPYAPQQHGSAAQAGYGPTGAYAQPYGSAWHAPAASPAYSGAPQAGYCANDAQCGAAQQDPGAYGSPTAAYQPPAYGMPPSAYGGPPPTGAQAPLTYGVPS